MTGSHSSTRVGVVGCGYWGSKHVRTLSGIDNVSQVSIIDANLAKAEDLSARFPGSRAFSSLTDALDHVDAVVVATQPGLHTELALEAIEAGKHVMVEKPLAPTSRECRQIIDAAEAAGVTLMVGHTYEYNAAVWKLRNMVEGGELGDLYYLDSQRLNLGLYQHDVNVMFDLAPHDISVMNYVVGSMPDAVECWASSYAHSELEDVGHIRLHYSKPNVTANIHVSWLDPCKVRRVTVVGSRKMVVFDDMAEERIRVHDKGVVMPSDLVAGDLTKAPMSYRYGDVVSPYLSLNEPLAVEDQHFVDSCLQGTTPISSGAKGLAVVEVLEAATMAARERRPVELGEIRGNDSLDVFGSRLRVGQGV